MAVKAGEAFVEIFADSTKLQSSLKKASAKLKKFGASATKIGLGVAGIGVALAAPFIKAISVFSKVGDELDKMSKRTGFAVESLSALGFAAEQSGANLATLEKGIRTMQRVINDLERGLSTSKDAFEDLGITLKEIIDLSPEDQFKLIAQKVSEIEDPTKKAALAMQVFGKAGSQLIPLLDGGAKGIEAFIKEAEKLGLVVTGEEAAAAAEFTDEVNILTRSFEKLFFNIGSSVLPIFKDLRVFFQALTTDAIKFAKENAPLLQSLLKIAIAAIAVGTALAGFGVVITTVGFTLSGLATIIGAVTSSMLIFTSVFTAAGVAISLISIVIDLASAAFIILTSATALQTVATTVLTGAIGLLSAAFALLISPIGLVAIAVVVLIDSLDLIGKAADAISGSFTDFGSTASSVMDQIIKKVKAGDLEGAFSLMSENIQFIFVNLRDSVVSTFTGFIDEIQVKANQLAVILKEIASVGFADTKAESEFLSTFVKEEEKRRDNAAKARLEKIREQGKAEREEIDKTRKAKEEADLGDKSKLNKIKADGKAERDEAAKTLKAKEEAAEQDKIISEEVIETRKMQEEKAKEEVITGAEEGIQKRLVEVDVKTDEELNRTNEDLISKIIDLKNKFTEAQFQDIADNLGDPIESVLQTAGSFSGVELSGQSRTIEREALTAQKETAKNTKDLLIQNRNNGVTFA